MSLPLLLAACSAPQVYTSGQQWQKFECERLQDRNERERCRQSNASSYDAYQAEAAKATAPR